MTDIDGLVADVLAVVNDADITTGGFDSVLSGEVDVADANTIANATGGIVTATLTAGTLASFAALDETGNAYTITVTDENTQTLQASILSTLGGKTTAQVTVSNAVTISGTSAELMAALVTVDTKVVASVAKVTFTDAPSIAQFAAIDAAVGGTLTYTSIADTLAALVTDAGNGVAAVAFNRPITVTDSGTIGAADLSTVSANTTQTVTATAATTISGSTAQLLALVNDAGIASRANYNALITGTAGVADLSTIDADTGGTVTVTNVTDTFSAIQTYNGVSSANAAILQNSLGTITANGGANPDTVDFSAVLKGMTINGLAGNDVITGTDFADVISGGTGADAMLGGGGVDIFVFSTGDAPTALVGAATYDMISDFNTAQDRIDLAVMPVLGSSEVNASAMIGGAMGTVSIDAAGEVTFSGSGVSSLTMTEALAAVRTLVTGAGELAHFQFDDGVNGSGESTFVYQENGASSSDILILLTGVTGIADFSTTLGDANTLYVY